MQIVVTFNTFEEMEAFAGQILERRPATAAELNETAKKTADIINRTEEREAADKSPKKAEAGKPAKAAEKPAKKAQEEPAGASGSSIGETEVKLLLSEKLKAGKKAAVKELFQRYDVEKLSELIEKHPDRLGEFYKEAEGI